MMSEQLKQKVGGVIVPMITPFTDNYKIDIEAVERIADLFLRSGVSPFVLGTTGESASIAAEKKDVLVKTTVELFKDKRIIYAGISDTCQSSSIEAGKKYGDLGVDVLVAHVPGYFPLNPDQMLSYFEQLADNIPCPLIIYNIPSTTHHSIPLETLDKLSYHQNIIGVKDSERSIERLDNSISLWKNREDYIHMVGWAAKSSYALHGGSNGIIPSTGNIVPELYYELFQAVQMNDMDKAVALQEKTEYISSLYQKDKILSEAIPRLKIMMTLLGLCGPQVLPPLYRMSKELELEYKREIERELTKLNIYEQIG